MKVKFLKSGIQAHAEQKRGTFPFKAGDEMDGLNEVTVANMVASGCAEVIDSDSDDEPAADGEDEGTTNSDDESDDAKDATMTSGKFPWSKS